MPINTKAIIVTTFMELSKQNSIDKITVTDIVNACGLSRQSFYYHFRDMIEVIEWAAKQKTKETLARSLAADTPEAALQELISAVVDDHSFIHKLSISNKRSYVEHIFLQEIRSYLREMIRHRWPLELPPPDSELEICFYSWGLTGILLDYCDSRDVDAEQVAKRICQLFRTGGCNMD